MLEQPRQFLELSVLSEKVQSYIQANSNYDTQRNYLGMSGIGKCPRQLYDNFIQPSKPTDEMYRNCYLGYLWEDEAKDILEGAGIYKTDSERELVAPFDKRFKGHTDGETPEGNLLEIKSVTAYSMERLKREARVKREHFYQVQTYMRYGDYAQALVAYVSRDPMEFHFISVPRVAATGEQMERKAKVVLQAIDLKERPACECGRC
jgi:hypothetical protein